MTTVGFVLSTGASVELEEDSAILEEAAHVSVQVGSALLPGEEQRRKVNKNIWYGLETGDTTNYTKEEENI